MAGCLVSRALWFVAVALAVASSAFGRTETVAPSPGPSSDGTSIDQGVAYVLMVVALVLTYLIHPLDASSSFGFF